MIRKIASCLIAAAAIAAFATPASARETHRYTVSFAALDLSSDSGAAVARQRIERAAQMACGDSHQRRAPLYETAAYNTCVAEVVSSASRSLESGIAAARHRSFAAR